MCISCSTPWARKGHCFDNEFLIGSLDVADTCENKWNYIKLHGEFLELACWHITLNISLNNRSTCSTFASDTFHCKFAENFENNHLRMNSRLRGCVFKTMRFWKAPISGDFQKWCILGAYPCRRDLKLHPKVHWTSFTSNARDIKKARLDVKVLYLETQERLAVRNIAEKYLSYLIYSTLNLIHEY